MLEFVFQNLSTLKLERDQILKFDFDIVSQINGDVVLEGLRVELNYDDKLYDKLSTCSITSFFYKNIQYFIDYDDGGYVGGNNINQHIYKDDQKLIISIK